MGSNKKEDPIMELGRLLDEHDKSVTTVDESEVKKLEVVYEELVKMFGKKNVKKEIGSVLRSSGGVSVIGRNIEVGKDIEMFAELIATADSFEIIPKVNGTVEMEFGFNHLMK